MASAIPVVRAALSLPVTEEASSPDIVMEQAIVTVSYAVGVMEGGSVGFRTGCCVGLGVEVVEGASEAFPMGGCVGLAVGLGEASHDASLNVPPIHWVVPTAWNPGTQVTLQLQPLYKVVFSSLQRPVKNPLTGSEGLLQVELVATATLFETVGNVRPVRI